MISSLNVAVNLTHEEDNGSKGICCKQGFGWRKGAIMDGPHVPQDGDILRARGIWPGTDITNAGMRIQGLLL
jgi:hypothetical protein